MLFTGGRCRVQPYNFHHFYPGPNTHACMIACRALNLLLAGGDVQSAALLTPYNGQVRQLRTELDSRNFLFRGNRSLELVVSTIDGFQVTSWAEVLLFSGSLVALGAAVWLICV